MPKRITQYKVFIGSPGGLEAERKVFKEFVDRCSDHHGLARSVLFSPVGWEETLGGAGRPQELINNDLKQSDYAIFILHDRWGSPTGTHESGFEEEFALAEDLNRQGKLLGYFLFLKPIDPAKLADPGDQLKKVIAFRERMKAERKLLYKEFADLRSLEDLLDGHLAQWLRDHEARESGSLMRSGQTEAAPITGVPGVAARKTTSAPADPGFDFWYRQSMAISGEGSDQVMTGLYFAKQAIDRARSDVEVASAHRRFSYFQFYAGRLDDALATCDDIISRFGAATKPELQEQVAGALVNKGVTLGVLGRKDEAIAVYDDVLARFGTATELELREPVASALVNKGVALGALGRNYEAIAVYDEVLARFGTATEPALRERVARALVNQGFTLGALGRNDEAIAVCDDVLARFGTATEPALRGQVARALFNKGVTLGALGRNDEEIAVYDEVLARFGTATEPALREQVARALVNQGVALGALGRNDEEIAVYDEVLARFGTATEPALREQVARALFNKGVTLGVLGRKDEAIAVCDDVLARFGAATEPELVEVVGRAKRLCGQLLRKR